VVPFLEGTPLWDIPHIETATVGYHSVALKACQIFRQQIPSAFAGLKEWGAGLIFCHRIRKVFSFATFPTRTIDRPFGLNILCKFCEDVAEDDVGPLAPQSYSSVVETTHDDMLTLTDFAEPLYKEPTATWPSIDKIPPSAIEAYQ